MEKVLDKNNFETIDRLKAELKQVKIERDNARVALIKVNVELERLIKFLVCIKQVE